MKGDVFAVIVVRTAAVAAVAHKRTFRFPSFIVFFIFSIGGSGGGGGHGGSDSECEVCWCMLVWVAGGCGEETPFGCCFCNEAAAAKVTLLAEALHTARSTATILVHFIVQVFRLSAARRDAGEPS